MILSDYLYIIAPLVGWIAAQTAKLFLSLRQDGITWDDMFASGGMPSSHSSFVSALVIVLGLENGFNSPVFGLGLTLLGVVVYDAVGVRRATGENTRVISEILRKVKIKQHDVALHLALGHTPIQVVAGVFVGVSSGLLVHTLVV